MSRENRSRYALLGLLSYGPMSGYDIRKTIDNSISHFWSESYGQIYPMLKELVDEGLATVKREEQESKPDRKVYSITPKGEEALRAWLAEPVAVSKLRNELLLKLFFGSKVEQSVMRQHLERCREQVQGMLTVYEAIESGVRQEDVPAADRLYWLSTLSFGLHMSKATLDWCNETLQQLDSLPADEEENEAKG